MDCSVVAKPKEEKNIIKRWSEISSQAKNSLFFLIWYIMSDPTAGRSMHHPPSPYPISPIPVCCV